MSIPKIHELGYLSVSIPKIHPNNHSLSAVLVSLHWTSDNWSKITCTKKLYDLGYLITSIPDSECIFLSENHEVSVNTHNTVLLHALNSNLYCLSQL